MLHSAACQTMDAEVNVKDDEPARRSNRIIAFAVGVLRLASATTITSNDFSLARAIVPTTSLSPSRRCLRMSATTRSQRDPRRIGSLRLAGPI